ncbi:MAG: AtpZ/AtpI family protein [Lachnospiraceae bacterium]|nr:AtpZ/AtpI family protein [Lachnospiraceae bacterium]
MKQDRNIIRLLAMVTQFGLNMLVPIFMCSFLGMYLDRKLGTSFWMIVLFFLGAVAGFRNIYILAMRTASRSEKEERRNARKRRENHSDK